MKKAKSNSTSDGEDIQLHKLYNALRSPQSSSSKRYIELLSSAPVTSIDHLLRKISSYARKSCQPSGSTEDVLGKKPSDEWPVHRLLICFDAVLGKLKHRSCQHDLLPLRSFKACVRLVLDAFSEGMAANDDCVIYAATKLNGAKCWYKLLDYLAKLTHRSTSITTTKTTETGLVKAILKDIRSKQTHLYILDWATNVSEHDMSPYLLHSTSQQTILRAKCYGLRGLLVQSSFFGSDLILHDAYRRLLCKPLFFYFGQGSHSVMKQGRGASSMKTAEGKRRRLQQPHEDATYLLSMCTFASQLLDALCKVEVTQKDTFGSERGQYTWELFLRSSTSHSTALARTWTGAILDLLHIEDTTATQQNNDKVDKGRLFYCLTTVLMKAPPDSNVFIYLAPSGQQSSGSDGVSTTSWIKALPLLFAQFVYYLHQGGVSSNGGATGNKSTNTNILKSVYTMDVLMKLLTRLCHISWRCLVLYLARKRQSIDKRVEVGLQQFGAKMMGCLTNFLLAFTAYPVSIETLITLALGDGYGGGGDIDDDVNNNMSPTLLSMDLCADVVIRGYFGLTTSVILDCQDLLGPLLETMMQYIQVVPSTWRLEIGPRIAWCVRSQMALLNGDDKVDDSPLLPKFQKLVVYLLHDDGAIDQMAESSTGLGKYLWEPTITQAHAGLKVAAALATAPTTRSELESSPPAASPENLQVLAKSKRALLALEKISRHPRACERLTETNILDLIDITLIPCTWASSSLSHDNGLETNMWNDLLLRAPVQIWSVYGLLVRLLASLAERTSLMRTKLLQEKQLVDVIMGLLWCTLRCQTTLYAEFQQQDQNEEIKKRIMTCQHVVVASLQVVYAYRYDKSATLDWVSWKREDEQGRTLTLVSALVCILVPWYYDDLGDKSANDNNGIQYQWMIFSNQMTSALDLLEHLSYLDECGKQLIQGNSRALQELSRWLVVLSNLVESSHDQTIPHRPGGSSGQEMVQSQDDDREVDAGDEDIWRNQLDAEGGSGLDDESRQNQLDPGNDDVGNDHLDDLLATLLCDSTSNTGYDSGDGTPDNLEYAVLMTTLAYRIKNAFVVPLVRALTKLMTTNANLKVMILTDGFTRLFGPILARAQTLAVEQKVNNSFIWSIAAQLGEALWKRMDDLERLFQFFGQNDIDINHRHELTAVALAYAAFWKTEHWRSTLNLFGFDTEKESIVYSTGPFGILCHMLMLNEEHNGKLDDCHTSGGGGDTIGIPTWDGNNAKRHSAAQALSIVAHSFCTTWQQQLDENLEYNDQQLQKLLSHHIAEMRQDSTVNGSGNQLLIRTDDISVPLHVNTKDLIWISPAFKAMLSDHYSEANTESIHLHEITMASLQHFIHVSQSLQNYSIGQHETTVAESEMILDKFDGDGWDAVITLIHMADRYGSRLVQLLGERWIMKQIKMRQQGYLGGCLATYRRLKDKHGMLDGGGLTNDSWPFGRILNECTKAMLLDLVGLTKSAAFSELVQIDDHSNNLDDIEIFCNAALVLYQRSSI